jgi:hypothetical protein
METRHRIETFLKPLLLALYDCELESRGYSIINYFDTDTILKTILGFVWLSENTESDNKKLLTRSLLSCGLLGKIYVLRPHALELSDKLNYLKIIKDIGSQKKYLSDANLFLESTGIKSIMRRLSNVIAGKGKYFILNRNEKIQIFIDILSDHPGDTFSYIENVNGTWLQRLNRYYNDKILCFDRMGPELSEITYRYKDTIRTIYHILRQKRPDRSLSINVYQDALALTLLFHFKESQAEKEIVRFYTDTSLLEKAIIEEQELRPLLTYESINTEVLSKNNNRDLIIRDANYFIVRTWFNELSYAKNEGIKTFENTKYLANKLVELLEKKEEDLEGAIQKIEYEGKKLHELITDFENLTIMDTIWVTKKIPEKFKTVELLKDWLSIFEFAENRNTEKMLFIRIQDVRTEIEKKVYKLKAWLINLEYIKEKCSLVRSKIKLRIEDPMRDLGLVRWGYNLSFEEKGYLIDTLKSLILEPEDESIQIHQVSEISFQIEQAKYDPKKCQLICALLWALMGYHYIVQIVQDCINNNRDKEIDPTLLVIQAAAKVKTGELSTHADRKKIVNELWQLQKKAPTKQRMAILLGVGYVLYHAWKIDKLGDKISSLVSNERQEELNAWANKCFQIGEEAAKLLPPNSLAWAFAINHCAYVGIVIDIESQKTENYFRTLLKFENLPAFWNHRFSDTIGTYYLLLAEREWEKRSHEERKKLDISRILSKAREYFQKALIMDVGDIDIDEHINRLNILEEKYTRLK